MSCQEGWRLDFEEYWDKGDKCVQSCFPQLWALSLQKFQKNALTLISANGTASFHLGLLLVTVPGTAASHTENFVVLDAI